MQTNLISLTERTTTMSDTYKAAIEVRQGHYYPRRAVESYLGEINETCKPSSRS